MIEIANGNGVTGTENYKEASLETTVPLVTVMVAEHQEHNQAWEKSRAVPILVIGGY